MAIHREYFRTQCKNMLLLYYSAYKEFHPKMEYIKTEKMNWTLNILEMSSLLESSD